MDKIRSSVELDSELLCQSWTEPELQKQLCAYRPKSIFSFGEVLKKNFQKASLKRELELLEAEIYFAPDLDELAQSVEEKKNLWSALKKTKSQIDDSL